EMIRRISCSDTEQRMPYKKDALSLQEINLLKRWIKEGARWDLPWAYQPVKNPEIPKTKKAWYQFSQPKLSPWPQQDLDWFVLDKIQKNQLTPAPKADSRRLGQRVSMDLIGLPLTGQLETTYLQDTSAFAFEKLVDSLLASPRFGERWAAPWLDLARYADTKGYERDARRFIWRYRDWVIRAFNQDIPYDQFLTEQLAGDLLPHPTDDQYIATAFHRNTMTNDEGGTDNEEFRVAAVLDRVNTTWTALMGATFNCVQCHGHPYDPFTHEEYYQFYAFFNNSRDEDTWEDYPALRHFSKDDSLKLLKLHGWLAQEVSTQKADEIRLFVQTWQPSYYSIAADSFRNCELYDTKWLTMRNHARARLKQVNLDDKNQLIWRYAAGVEKGVWQVRLDQPDGPLLFSVEVQKTAGREIQKIDFQAVAGTHDLWFLYDNPALEKPEDSGLMFDWMSFTNSFPGVEKPAGAAMQDTFWNLLRANSEFTPIMIDAPAQMARETHLFERGNWLTPGKEVTPGTPKALPPMPQGAPLNRLGLAQWLCSPEHPLTSRTMVNRIWEQLFGNGLVETLEDFGSQGAAPTHPELLDHLSWRFMHDHRWSIKKLLREIVLSATYQQDARSTPELEAKDPRNELLARGPRIRLTAEQIRDKALAVAGMLSPKMGGLGVMPFQPEGIWNSPWNGDDWKKSAGEDQYRRSIYTFVKRSSPYPSAVTFDLAPREVCAARRITTNTPLQALVTLNDSTFYEAAWFLADTIDKTVDGAVREKIARMYARATGLEMSPETGDILEKLYQRSFDLLGSSDEKKESKEAPQPRKVSTDAVIPDSRRMKALQLVANAIMNLDEFVTKA
ncbi:MAG: DUF1553 domain-containing protein, partial [Saprospiraceae bacterium]|nr:DUF1553 domain-containing protein [Saprospiraceae bacterium]